MTRTFTFLLFAILTLLTGCASTPEFNSEKADLTLSPAKVIEQGNASIGKQVFWGGLILKTSNMKTTTQLEVLAYPLNSFHQPEKTSSPMGRFIIKHQGYLEPTVYTQGRLVTLTGEIISIEKGKIGESVYEYPVILSKQLHLWGNEQNRVKTSIHFGIGIGL